MTVRICEDPTRLKRQPKGSSEENRVVRRDVAAFLTLSHSCPRSYGRCYDFFGGDSKLQAIAALFEDCRQAVSSRSHTIDLV